MRPIKLGFAVWATTLTVLMAGATRAAAQTNTAAEFEVFGGATLHLEGARAFVAMSSGRSTVVADSGEHNVLPAIGFAVNTWRTSHVGSFFDFSFVDGGSATAGIGSNVSTVKSSLFDFHGGLQAEYPGNRVRPYGVIGGGFAHVSTNGTLTMFGVTDEFHGSQWRSSIVYGGGVRLMLSDRVGLKIGLEGVTATPVKSDAGSSITYGRFVIGTVIGSKS